MNFAAAAVVFSPAGIATNALESALMTKPLEDVAGTVSRNRSENFDCEKDKRPRVEKLSIFYD